MIMIATHSKPPCPHAIKRGGYSKELDEYLFDVMCDLVDKYCLIEHGKDKDCEVYMEYLKEIKEDNK